MNAAERQADLALRRKAQGQKRIAQWIPGSTWHKVQREATARGITMRERIIEKLNA